MRGWRVSFLCASLATGAAAIAATELLSLFHSLTFRGIALFWIAVCIALLAVITVLLRKGRLHWPARRRGLERSLRILLAGVVVIVLVTGLTALVYPPNNADSMGYHLPRVVHWVQGGSVALYPTHSLRQAYSNPGAEFLLTHVLVLGGSDRFVNLVQWLCFLGCIIGASLIAEALGASRRGQVYTAAVTATIPMAILQASSTQNDLVTSFWMVCFVLFGLHMLKAVRAGRSARQWHYAVFAGGALGLAILTKGTAYVFAVPFAAWFLASLLLDGRTVRAGRRVGLVLLILALALVLNAGFFSRNARQGSPLTGGPDMLETWNTSFTPGTMVSNALRNSTLHIYGYPHQVKDLAYRAVRKTHSILGLDVNDLATTWMGSTYYAGSPGPFHEDLAGNPLHFLLIIVTSLAFFFSKRLRRNGKAVLYLFSLVLAALLFCYLLKWQPWGSRLQLPLFVLFSPFVGLALETPVPARLSRFIEKWRYLFAIPVLAFAAATVWGFARAPGLEKGDRLLLISCLLVIATVLFFLFARPRALVNWMTVVCVALLLLTLPYLFANSRRSIVGKGSVLTTERTELYFPGKPEQARPYINCVEYIRRSGAQDVGLVGGECLNEYPLLVFLGTAAGAPPRVEHIDVRNSTGSIPVPSKGFSPGLVLVTNTTTPVEFTDRYGTFRKVKDFGQGIARIMVYKRVKTAP